MDRLEVWKWALMPLGFIVQSAVNSGQDKHNHSTVIHLLAVCSLRRLTQTQYQQEILLGEVPTTLTICLSSLLL